MVAALVLLSVCGLGVAVAVSLWVSWLFSESRKEATRSWVFLHSLHKEAVKARDVEPWAGQMADQLANYLAK